MSKIRTFFKLAKRDPKHIWIIVGQKFAASKISRLWNDKSFLSFRFKCAFGYKMDFNNPKTFNEKMQWLKLYNRTSDKTIMVGKKTAKDYVRDICGDDYIIPTLGCWDSFDEIDFDTLPNQFVLKCTHDSGSVLICRDKASFNKEKAKKHFKKCLKRNMFWWGREWPYKNVKPQIIAEPFLLNGDSDFLQVYKFLCFNGIPRIIQTIQNDKQPNETIDYFDTEWNLLDIKQNYPNSENPLTKPILLDKMVQIAKLLSKNQPFVRIDLYLIDNTIKFSEFTFFSDCGFAKFTPSDIDELLGSWIALPSR